MRTENIAVLLLLCFLMPKRVIATEQVIMDPRLEQSEFGPTRKTLEAYMRNHTRAYCTCARPILQNKFCKHDFAVVVKRTSKDEEKFCGTRLPWPFCGTILNLEVEHSFRGPMKMNTTEEFRFIQGSICGVREKMIPAVGQSFFITGFEAEIPFEGSQDKAGKAYLVTRCATSMPVEKLTMTQITGLFLGLYNCNEELCGEPHAYFTKSELEFAPAHNCYYPFAARACYDRYAICSKTTSGTCGFFAPEKVHAEPDVLAKIPASLHDKFITEAHSSINDSTRLQTCLWHYHVE